MTHVYFQQLLHSCNEGPQLTVCWQFSSSKEMFLFPKNNSTVPENCSIEKIEAHIWLKSAIRFQIFPSRQAQEQAKREDTYLQWSVNRDTCVVVLKVLRFRIVPYRDTIKHIHVITTSWCALHWTVRHGQIHRTLTVNVQHDRGCVGIACPAVFRFLGINGYHGVYELQKKHTGINVAYQWKKTFFLSKFW